MAHAQDWIWSRHIGGPGLETGVIGHVDAAGNAYVYGRYAGWYGDEYSDVYVDGDTLFGRRDSYVAKYAANGDLLWIKNCSSTTGDMLIGSMAFDTLNNVLYVTGSYYGNCSLDTCTIDPPSYAAVLAKLTPDGACLWLRNVGVSGAHASSTGLTIDDNGDVYTAGFTDPYVGGIVNGINLPPCSFLVKYDPAGDVIWSKMVAPSFGPNHQFGAGVLRYRDGSIYSLGMVINTSANDSITVDSITLRGIHGGGCALLCLDAMNGIARWIRPAVSTTTAGIYPQQLDLDAAGNIYYVQGFYDTTYFIGVDTVFMTPLPSLGPWAGLLKYNTAGERLYLRQFTSSQSCYPIGIDVAPDGSLLMSGSFGTDADFGTVQLTGEGFADLFISAHDTAGECLDVLQVANGEGVSVAGTESGVYVSILFADPFWGLPDSIVLDQTYLTYGFSDVVFAKHDKITGMGDFKSDENDALIIYANPNNGSFRIKVPDPFLHEQGLLLSVYDNTGRLVRMQTLNMQEEHPRMDIWDVGKGLYTVTLAKGDRTYSGSMVVE